MGQVPFVSIGHVRSLKHLDLSNNRIAKIEDPFFKGRIRLDTLMLRENDLAVLTPGAFLNFEYVNHTSLAGNPIRRVLSGAFVDTSIRALDLSNCLIHTLAPEAFRGLEKSLDALDLSANRLKSIPADLFDDFDHVRRLQLNDNMLSLSPNASFNGFRYVKF